MQFGVANLEMWKMSSVGAGSGSSSFRLLGIVYDLFVRVLCVVRAVGATAGGTCNRRDVRKGS